MNGDFAGSDTSSPYGASYDINASGIYEVYAMASDDDGNDITSTVKRIKVVEAIDVADPITINDIPSTYLGGWGIISSL